MITTKMRPPRNMGEDKRFELSFSGVAAGVPVVTAPGVAVGSTAVWVHHWFIEDASKADTCDCRSGWLNPACTPAGSVNIWFACMVTELLVYWSTNITEPSITWIVAAPLETVTT